MTQYFNHRTRWALMSHDGHIYNRQSKRPNKWKCSFQQCPAEAETKKSVVIKTSRHNHAKDYPRIAAEIVKEQLIEWGVSNFGVQAKEIFDPIYDSLTSEVRYHMAKKSDILSIIKDKRRKKQPVEEQSQSRHFLFQIEKIQDPIVAGLLIPSANILNSYYEKVGIIQPSNANIDSLAFPSMPSGDQQQPSQQQLQQQHSETLRTSEMFESIVGITVPPYCTSTLPITTPPWYGNTETQTDTEMPELSTSDNDNNFQMPPDMLDNIDFDNFDYFDYDFDDIEPFENFFDNNQMLPVATDYSFENNDNLQQDLVPSTTADTVIDGSSFSFSPTPPTTNFSPIRSTTLSTTLSTTPPTTLPTTTKITRKSQHPKTSRLSEAINRIYQKQHIPIPTNEHPTSRSCQSANLFNPIECDPASNTEKSNTTSFVNSNINASTFNTNGTNITDQNYANFNDPQDLPIFSGFHQSNHLLMEYNNNSLNQNFGDTNISASNISNNFGHENLQMISDNPNIASSTQNHDISTTSISENEISLPKITNKKILKILSLPDFDERQQQLNEFEADLLAEKKKNSEILDQYFAVFKQKD